MERKEVNIGIRSVLNSSPSALTINDVWQDYIKLIGSPIPLRQLGYRSLHEYLRSIPEVVSLDDPNSPHSLVRAVTDAKSEHIAKFVQGQKPSKSTRFPPRRRITRGGQGFRSSNDFVPIDFQRRILDMLTRYVDGLHIEDFREIIAVIQQDMQLQCPFDSVLRRISSYVVMDGDDIRLSRQYLNIYSAPSGQNPAKRPNEVIVMSESDGEYGEYDDFLSDYSGSEECDYTSPPKSTDELQHTTATRRPPSRDEANCAGLSTRSLISDTLVKNCFALLDENPNGFWLSDLAVKYEAKFGYRLDPQQHGFDCVLDMVIQLKDVFNMIQYEKSGDRFLRDARKFSNDSTNGDQGELPKSVVLEIKKLLLMRSNHQLYTDELSAEYRECYKKTLDPTDFGFKNMDGLLKSLNDNESSVFSFKQVRQRTVMYLKALPNQEQSYAQELDSEGALPCNYDFNFLPQEVVNYDYKLPVNPILETLVPGQRISVKMAEVYGPERFYLHFADDEATLNSMMEDLHIFYENNSNTYELSHDTIRRGMLCACPFHQDSKWHRVQVVMCRGTSDVKVRYFDYGTLREVSVGKLRYLHVDFAKLPALCVRAKLNGTKLKQFDASRKEEQKSYSRLVGESFFDLANHARELVAEIFEVDLVNQTIEVHLFATYENGEVIPIHEKLIEDGLVLNKETEPVTEIPLPSSPQKKPATNVASAVSSSPSTSATTSTNTDKGQEKSKKSRPPPGIPIPPDLSMATSSSSASTQTQTSNQSKTTFNGYTQSKMNPMQAPFYPPGYSPIPTSSVPSPMYTTPTQSMPMGPTLPMPMVPTLPPQQFMYSTPQQPRAPPVYQSSSVYGPHGPAGYPPLPYYSSAYESYGMPLPQPQPMYDYYARAQMPSTYNSYVPPQAGTKPPPGFNYKPTTATAKTPSASHPAPGFPSVAEATGIPLYSCPVSSTSLNSGSCVEHAALNTYCCCGLDCSLNVLSSNPVKSSFTDQNDKPQWISKLEVVRDLVLREDLSPESVTGKLKEIIGDINADTSKTEVLENAMKPVPTKKQPVSPTSYAALVNDTLTSNLNGLSINDRKSSTPAPVPLAESTSNRIELISTSPITPTRSESEFSVKSEDRESTKDEIKQAKIEQLRMFVMLQSKNLKKT